ncbi:uncharacterized protein LOC112905823 [Agrilus planipennis]|uniref:Uncharacterized protein LOC112905823 n=1 Tax=Agrilus planipennis TaxID=224129 RepID=A0A7F5RFT1_AGRPL|nr:uncharacterized protein LOC112905823 [Agrilus planipennis]
MKPTKEKSQVFQHLFTTQNIQESQSYHTEHGGRGTIPPEIWSHDTKNQDEPEPQSHQGYPGSVMDIGPTQWINQDIKITRTTLDIEGPDVETPGSEVYRVRILRGWKTSGFPRSSVRYEGFKL